jgi:hypothetical protein
MKRARITEKSRAVVIEHSQLDLRDVGLPGHRTQGRDVRADREVDVPLLAAHHGVVAEVRPHDHRAERDAVLEHLEEVPDRDVLSARDAVEVGVEQPDGLDALAPERRDGRLRIVTDRHREVASWSWLTRALARASA